MVLVRRFKNVRLLRSLSLLLCVNTVAHAAPEKQKASSNFWYTNYQDALKKAKDSHKGLLVLFSGSDWCGSCMKIKREVLSNPAFISKIQSAFVCLEIDFPRHKNLDEAIRKQNMALKERFHVDEFPCLVLLTKEEREVFRVISFGNESGEGLAGHLQHIMKSDELLQKALPVLHKLSLEELRECYDLAQELGRRDIIKNILSLGVKEDDYFFLSEQFRLLVEGGKMDTEECVKLKKRLLSKDPKNERQTHFTVALIEFQELAKRSKEGVRQDSSQVIAPLESYLAQFGRQDKENVWRIEMMIAQFYSESDQWDFARKHAEVAYEFAPNNVRSHISQSLDYIKDQECCS
ncbi:thioredoxin family protein [Chlamydiifrater phoenicopteri]|uniref:thioredoxin family protein n=1 Tax=Chlamydiifrater phoenicopteri TaxID=2681469 RepID=UPI001BCE9173|nr:thioredoxin family protein [Chlamydiifrater phoenicopteri]